ncbi:hypothetical protein A1F94_009273 [Pyrenophora tritici-repentis]|uniref:Uncharacterized protein n=1 Tax=Pyrenophora tritici-repentis TaxID=45151 RepID=A0A2W1EEW3_9PLEO|nr:hypothetical protein PtrV1_12420 [Pyrenophora tritici-repentis]KAF7445224.1 hypothetical protein A1F99_102100 [Pyrenophora tritici-repentis]KAF7565489.1 hypothetical protein PtrM4_049230 [Pyrenophora tritici-repentis]KAG9380378.1 hypothetical protein A1F94_009273 [Pyrenophora tritici-repentis]KAI0584685.1 hypothetical protein Alg215_02922 [Pyrenophora tritici-repentis]
MKITAIIAVLVAVAAAQSGNLAAGELTPIAAQANATLAYAVKERERLLEYDIGYSKDL